MHQILELLIFFVHKNVLESVYIQYTIKDLTEYAIFKMHYVLINLSFSWENMVPLM